MSDTGAPTNDTQRRDSSPQRLTSRDVFIQGVEDALSGTPHARHPVQFEAIPRSVLSTCTLCFAVVRRVNETNHRTWHDRHVKEHDRIMEQAQRHVPEPTYGGRRG